MKNYLLVVQVAAGNRNSCLLGWKDEKRAFSYIVKNVLMVCIVASGGTLSIRLGLYVHRRKQRCLN